MDLLSLDTEGAELGVLAGIDWDRVTVSVIITEMMISPDQIPSEVDAFLLAR